MKTTLPAFSLWFFLSVLTVSRTAFGAMLLPGESLLGWALLHYSLWVVLALLLVSHLLHLRGSSSARKRLLAASFAAGLASIALAEPDGVGFTITAGFMILSAFAFKQRNGVAIPTPSSANARNFWIPPIAAVLGSALFAGFFVHPEWIPGSDFSRFGTEKYVFPILITAASLLLTASILVLADALISRFAHRLHGSVSSTGLMFACLSLVFVLIVRNAIRAELDLTGLTNMVWLIAIPAYSLGAHLTSLHGKPFFDGFTSGFLQSGWVSRYNTKGIILLISFGLSGFAYAINVGFLFNPWYHIFSIFKGALFFSAVILASAFLVRLLPSRLAQNPRAGMALMVVGFLFSMGVFNAFSRHPALKWTLVQYSEYPRVYTALTNIFLPNALSLHVFQSGEPQQHRPDHFYADRPMSLRQVKPSLLPDSLNLIVVVVDALRADVVTRDVPQEYIPEKLLRWAEQDAVSFSRAYSPSNSSFRSAAILFGADANRHVLYPSSGLDNLLDVWLQEKGYRPLIVTNATGTIEMFGTGASVISLGKPYELDTKKNIPAEQLIDAFKTQLLAHRGSTPFFGYLHLMDVHNDLYAKPGVPLLADTPFDLYRHNVRYVSDVWGDFIDWMTSAGLYDNTIIVFTSDHGEEFKEHDSTLHGHHFFEEDLHVPLFMRIPGFEPADFDKPVYTPDWLTTLLDLSGYAPEHPLYPDGFTQSLSMVFTGDSAAIAAYDRPELYFQSNMTDKVGLLWQGRWKYEYWPTYQAHALFDLQNDPRERTNVIDDHPELARELHAKVVRNASIINGWTLKGGFSHQNAYPDPR